MVAGVVFIAAFSMFGQTNKLDKFDATSTREPAQLLTVPLSTEKNFDCNVWFEKWVSDNNARIVYIHGYKAATHGQTLGLRGDEVRAERAELAMCTKDYRYFGYGFVSEQALVNAVENAFEYQSKAASNAT